MLGAVPEIGTSAVRHRVALSGIAAAGILLAAMVWLWLGTAPARDLSAERRALEMRASELNAQALAPGSALACLDALAGENVEAACEKAIFASPASVASAASYVAARFNLFADMVAYGKHGGRDIDGVLLSLRRSLESDRFGFVAHVLAMRDGCTSQGCNMLALLRDASRVRANLSGGMFDRYVEHYLTVWNQTPDGPLADSTAGPGQAGAQATPGAPRKVTVNIDFPTAASIPPISIMNPEPKGPATTTGPAAVAAGASGGEPTAKHSRKQAATPPAAAAAPSPPPAASAAPAVDPVWTPGATLAAPQATAPVQPPASGLPMQLNPPAAPEASAAPAARTQ
jgi:hypothetical protein